MTKLSPSSLRCPALERDVLASLHRASMGIASGAGGPPPAEQLFRAEMEAVTDAIEKRSRFALLKRFIAHGSKLPSWEKGFRDAPGHLDDEELALCVNFVTGHMVTKFQGKLAEMLAAGTLAGLADKLVESRRLPAGGSLVFGRAIRCLPRSSPMGASGDHVGGVEGPDAAYVADLPGGRVEVRLLAEVKSYSVGAARLRVQSAGHLQALRRGAILRGRRLAPGDAVAPRGGPLRVFVRPSDWRLTREFRLEKDRSGAHQAVMGNQALPAETTTVRETGRGEWTIRLAWSRDALRAVAFRLMHSYMGEAGEALAAEGAIRKDMSPEEAGENDFLAQLHVAIFRQQEVEMDAARRGKTMELYNVLGFGWALGLGFRDKDGDPSMMFHEDLRDMAAESSRCRKLG